MSASDALTDANVDDREWMQRWQLERFRELGCTPDEALVLLLADIDWHDVDRLVRKGCEMRLAVRILT